MIYSLVGMKVFGWLPTNFIQTCKRSHTKSGSHVSAETCFGLGKKIGQSPTRLSLKKKVSN